jgi:predicted hotdog family 3-hydroxylacyl-ACP dehydratase
MQLSDLPKNADYFIPHRAPMLLVDEWVDIKENACVAKVKIHADMPFIQAEGLPSWVGIEIMAQTIAIYAGLQQRLKGQAPKLGFLLGSKKFEMVQDYFAIGEELQVEIQLQFLNRHQIGIFDCAIQTAQGRSTATILVAQPEDASSLFAQHG